MKLSLCFAAALLLLLPALQLAVAQDAATISIEFDNSKSTVLDRTKSAKIIEVLAKYVFYVPVNQVEIVGSLDQSGLLSSQAVVTYRAVGPTTNGKSVLANCQENARGRWLGLQNSVAENEIKRATDTWWPGDSVEVEKATCTAA